MVNQCFCLLSFCSNSLFLSPFSLSLSLSLCVFLCPSLFLSPFLSFFLFQLYQEHCSEIRSILGQKAMDLPHYHDLEWRLEVQLSSRALSRQVEPAVLLRLHTRDGGGWGRAWLSAFQTSLGLKGIHLSTKQKALSWSRNSAKTYSHKTNFKQQWNFTYVSTRYSSQPSRLFMFVLFKELFFVWQKFAVRFTTGWCACTFCFGLNNS